MEMKYEEALKELQTLIGEIENGNLDLDTLLGKIKRANELLAQCKLKLTKTEGEIQNIFRNENNKM